jgi:antitoxin component HigA of HigAB toxin-antitoxin module
MTTATYNVSKVQGFPLLKIESEKDYDRATELAEELMSRSSLSKSERRILDTLYILIEEYEGKHYDFDSLKGSPLGILKQLMSGKQMGAGDLADVIGSQSAASMILTGARAISTQQAIKLAKHFKVDVGLFLTEK